MESTLVSKLLRIAIVASAMLFIPFKDAEASRYQRISYGSWKGGIYINDKTGEFSHCVVSANYKSGITLLFSVTKSINWQVGFSKKTWNLTIGKKYKVRYQVDRQKVFSGTARAVSKKLSTIKLPATARLFNQMRRGRLLKVEAGDDLLKFNLTGTKKMLSRLLRCAKRNKYLVVNRSLSSSGSGSDNPFESDGTTTAKAPSQNVPKKQPKRAYVISAAHRSEAQTWYQKTLANSLAGGGVSYRLIKNQGKAQKMYRKHAIIWRVGVKTGIIGTLRIFAKSKPERLKNSVLANEARKCKGDFASKFLKDDTISTIKISRLLATCLRNSGKQWSAYYALTARPQGGTYLVSVLSNKAPADAVMDSGERISGSMQIVNTTTSETNVEDDDLPIDDDDDKVVTY